MPSAGLVSDPNNLIGAVTAVQPAGTYDDELLDAHYITGDGRGNENIGLTAMHHIFHSEHNGVLQDIKSLVATFPVGSPAALSQWQLSPGVWNGERLFQAAKFVTEMEYQHIVFEEFARFVQPAVNAFSQYDASIDPAITAEFAHAVYRFGHSMLTETLPRINADGSNNNIGLIDAFTNPVEFLDGGSAGPLNADQAAGAIVQGLVTQRGNAIDEFVTEALRNNLLGLPLDLATLNMTRARSEGIPTLNEARRVFYAGSAGTGSLNSSVKPYSNWIDFGLALRHPASLVNFVAAYGAHPTIKAATTVVDKRAAANLLVNGGAGAPADRLAFMGSTGAWANVGGVSVTGLDDVDLWIGGLAESSPVFGGMLGTTFNFVFETQMEKLQDNDRFYYLARLAGLHFLEQVEGGSFAELAMRNTTARDLPALAFTRPDWSFDISKQTDPNGIVDDPATPYNKTNLDGTARLIRMPDGTIRLAGGGTSENHSLFAGTNGDDRMQGAEGDDSLWGNNGNNVMEGGAGADHLLGGAGADILTDNFGVDVLNGGDGNDVVAGGRGPDVLLGGNGSDFVIHGDDPTESFGGLGNDLIQGGAGADSIQGNEGDDWIEGGGGADVIRGDNAAPFPISAGGNDVLLGDAGLDSYGGEGGMDVMVGGAGPALIDGGLGFDWVTYVRRTNPATADLLNTTLAPPNPLNLNDRFLFDEGVSGGPLDDVIRGDAGNGLGHELTHDNLSQITGLSTLLSSDGALLPGAGATPAFDVTGNILLGGPGNNILEGRGGNDLIDGDAELNVRLVAVDKSGTTINANKMSDLQLALLDGSIDPGSIRIVREILSTPGGTSCDTAQFTDVRSNYTVTANANGTWTVTHLALGLDGVDTLRNIERLKFADKFVAIGAPGTCSGNATGTVTISDPQPTENKVLTATPAIVDPNGFDPTAVVLSWQAETTPGTWVTIRTGTTFTPTNAEVGLRLRVEATYTDTILVLETVTGDPTGPVANVNNPPIGVPILGTTTPRIDQAVTADPNQITDADGLVGVTFSFQWQSDTGTGFQDIAGATGAQFTPTTAEVGFPIRVLVSYVDNHGTTEAVASAATSPVLGPAPSPVAVVTPTSLTFGSQNTGSVSAIQVITVTNTGPADLHVSAVTLDGIDPTQFAIANGCTTVAPTGSCTVGVTFGPTAAGDKSATVRFFHDAAGSPAIVSLSGTGVAVPFPVAEVSPASLTFGAQTIGTVSASQSITVRNTGTATLVVSGPSLSGTAAASFAIAGNTCTTVAPAGSCTFSVRFQPTTIGAKTAQIAIATNAAGSPAIVPLTGSAVGLSTTFSMPASLAFGTRPLNTIATVSVLVTNTGKNPLVISSATATSPFATVGLGTCSTAVAAGRTCKLNVTLTPTARTSYVGTLTVVSSNATNSPRTVALTGTGK